MTNFCQEVLNSVGSYMPVFTVPHFTPGGGGNSLNFDTTRKASGEDSSLYLFHVPSFLVLPKWYPGYSCKSI